MVGENVEGDRTPRVPTRAAGLPLGLNAKSGFEMALSLDRSRWRQTLAHAAVSLEFSRRSLAGVPTGPYPIIFGSHAGTPKDPTGDLQTRFGAGGPVSPQGSYGSHVGQENPEKSVCSN